MRAHIYVYGKWPVSCEARSSMARVSSKGLPPTARPTGSCSRAPTALIIPEELSGARATSKDNLSGDQECLQEGVLVEASHALHDARVHRCLQRSTVRSIVGPMAISTCAG